MSHRLPTPQNLPCAISRKEVARVGAFLRYCDQQLNQPAEVVVYGSVAVHLYLADVSTLYTFETDDIDVHHSAPESLLRQLNRFRALRQDPAPEFRATNIEMWPAHPDWRSSTQLLSGLVGTQRLHVRVLHPVDLIVSKLERFNERDQVDCDVLLKRYIPNPDVLAQRTEQALEFALPNDTLHRRVRENLYWDILDWDIP